MKIISKTEFTNPASHVLTFEWLSMEDIAGFKKTAKWKNSDGGISLNNIKRNF